MQSENKPGSNGNSWMIWIIMAVVCVLLFPILSPNRPKNRPPPEPPAIPSAPQNLDPPLVDMPPEPGPAGTDKPYHADAIAQFRPLEEPANGYVSSSECRECHAAQHASWHASYHRSMTQVADAATVPLR